MQKLPILNIFYPHGQPVEGPQSRQNRLVAAHSQTNPPSSKKAERTCSSEPNHAPRIADQIRLKSQTLTGPEARYLLVDLEQIKQFVQEGETQRKERDQLQQ
jgi:hypothetical protein